MAKKLIDQDEAARILGVSPEEIGSLRDRKKLYPYRDGADWKYKQEDVERLRDELRQEKGDAAAEGADADVLLSEPKKTGESWDSTLGHVELELNDDLDSILLSEIELGKPAKDGPSTVIGKDQDIGSSDDDMVLADPKAKPTAPASGGSSSLLLEGSGLTLTSSSGIGSGIAKGKGSDVKLVASGSDITKKPPSGGSSDKLFGSDALSLSEDELTLVAPEEPKPAKQPSAGSSLNLDDSSLMLDSGSAPKLEGGSAPNLESDDDMSVLGDRPGGGSDVTQSPNDSGIMLASPSDSGLSLEEPLALGSSAKKLLDLGEENPNVAAGATGIGLVPGGSGKVEDEFQLSSAEAGEEDSDSGSQVIALDSDEDISSGMFAPVAQSGGLVDEETVAIPSGDVPLMAAAPVSTSMPTMMPAGGGMAAATLEAPFSTWNVVSLIACAVFLLLCGMMIFDLLKNMWSWNGPSTVSSSIMDALGNSIGWFDK